MSTPNFYNRKASKIFASECEEEFDYDDLIGNILSELKQAKPSDKYEDALRSYAGRIFAEIDKTIGKWGITINLIARSGYYSGVNLDWRVDIEDQQTGDSFEHGEDKISNTAENYISDQIAKIEKVYREYTTPLICVAVFSNGEAIYERAKYPEAVPAT